MDHDAEFDALVAMLSEAGPVEGCTDNEGVRQIRLTETG